MSNKQQQRARKPRRNRSPQRGRTRRRWVVLPLGLGVAALALYAAVQHSGRFGSSGAAPLDDIDDASRVRLERVLRDADLREGR